MPTHYNIGEESIVPDDTSEAGTVFHAMAELAQAGTTYDNMESSMSARGFDTETIVTALAGDADMNDKAMRLIRGLSQRDMIEVLSKRDEASLRAESKFSDAFGNAVRGPKGERPSHPHQPSHPGDANAVDMVSHIQAKTMISVVFFRLFHLVAQ